jgi:hypothetical protein
VSNDYSPEVYELIEGTSDTGYSISNPVNPDGSVDKDTWILVDASTNEILDPRRRSLEDILATIIRYGKLTEGLSA